MSRLSLRILLRGAGDEVRHECLQRWNPTERSVSGVKSQLALVSAAMEDEAAVLQRIGTLPRKLQDLLEAFFGDGGAVQTVQELFTI